MSHEPTNAAAKTVSGERESLSLRAWEALSPERELRSVLAAVAEIILPFVSFDGIGIVVFARETQRRLYALHLVGRPAPCEERGGGCLAVKRERANLEEIDSRVHVPYERTLQPVRSAEAYVCADLMAKQSWYRHEFRLAAAGIRAYASLPLIVHGERIGAAVFGRRQPTGFTEDQIEVLRDVSRAFAVAASNTLAYEEIGKLRNQLAVENIALKEQPGKTPWLEDIVGDSKALRKALAAVEQVANTEATVLITGETGTGKEMIARAIPRRSRQAEGPLISVNCAAIPQTLIASELFGHERGAFTGAHARRTGRFEQAHGGTLFLDEIGELTPEMQILLLRVLQEHKFERLGGTNTVQVDVRIIAATNRDLLEDVRAGRFREDLFYRLNVFPIVMPPLRQRLEDIPLLVSHFAAKHGKRHGRPVERIDRETMRLLESYDWPGNVRQLENLVERGVILSRGGTLRLERHSLPGAVPGVALNEQMRGEQRQVIEAALARTRGRISGASGAAALLRIPASTLESRIKRLGIDKFQFRSRRQERSLVVMPRINSG